jgi:cobalt-zinc-cadmium efflux system outer membrane protein
LRSDRLLFSNQVERALLELKTLAGMKPGEPLRLSGALVVPAAGLTLAEALKRALAGRPDLLAARLEVNLADAEVALAQAGAAPDLVATGRYSRSWTRFDAYGLSAPGGAAVPLRDADNVLTAGVSITLPVRNRNQGNIQAAVARRQAARYRAGYLEQSIAHELEAAYGRYETARQAARLFEDGVVRQSEENLRVLRAAYDLGERQVLEVITEQRRLVDTQKTYSEILRESYLALVDLERATASPLF